MVSKQIAVVFIRNDAGDFFVHQRSAAKKLFPNRYGLGAGGHVEEGEEIAQAAARELAEETGMTAPVRYVLTMDFDTPEMNHTVHLYETRGNGLITGDNGEWQWSGWMRRQEVDALLVQGKLCTDTGLLYQRYIAIRETKMAGK